jgi:hypothetical protein
MTDLQDHRDFAEAAIARSGMHLSEETLQPLVRAGVTADSERNTTGFFFREIHGDTRYFIVASPTRFPDFLTGVAQRTIAALDAVGPSLGRRICAPLHWGSIGGRSYIVYNDLALVSSHRIGVQVQKYWSSPSILGWLARTQSVTAQDVTGVADMERHFLEPLRRLESDMEMSAGVTGAARACRRLLAEGRARAMVCLEHGDFWLGNIMFDTARGKVGSAVTSDFRVIDWGGSKLEGYAGIDAVRFVLSAFGTGRRSALVLRAYGRALGLSREELVLHVYSALGYPIGAATEFPKERMNALTERVHRFLDENRFLEGLPRAAKTQRLPLREALRSHM